MARLARSPELYSLKKPAGRDITRIIVAASTETLSFVSIRAVIMPLTAVMSIALTETETINTASATSRRTFPDGRTSEKSRLFSLGENMPISDTAKVASAISTKSETESDCKINFIKEPRPIFFNGNGL